MTDLDLDAIAAAHHPRAGGGCCPFCAEPWPCPTAALVAEVRRLRDQTTALADALADIAAGECSRLHAPLCHEHDPDDPDEWCPVCVAEIAWSAWKVGQ